MCVFEGEKARNFNRNTFLTPCKERAIPRGAFTRVSRFLRTTSAELTHHPLLSGEEELFRSAKRETVKWFSTPFIALSSPMSALQRLKRLYRKEKRKTKRTTTFPLSKNPQSAIKLFKFFSKVSHLNKSQKGSKRKVFPYL